MKRVITTIESWDDYELAGGNQVPATTTVRFAYHDGRPGAPVQVELDLAAFNRDAFEKLIGPWLKAGHKPPAPVMAPVGRPAHTGTGSKHRRGIRDYNRDMRAFADAHGGPGDTGHPYHYHVQRGPLGKPVGKYYYSLSLRGKYAAHLEQEGKD